MLWPLIMYFVVVLALAAGLIALSRFVGECDRERATGQPYESGIVSEGSARVRLSARFYLVAMFFVILDLEAVFVFAWAMAARELGWRGYWEMVFFVAVLAAALIYLWRIGALEWAWKEPHGRKLARRG